MDFDEKNSKEVNLGEDVSGGRRVNFFGFKSNTGNYRKCDICGKYGAMHLSNGTDTCLNCLEKLVKIIGQDNTFKLLNTNSGAQKEILSPPTPTSGNTNNTKKSTT